MDYQANSKKSKEKTDPQTKTPPKVVEKVVVGEVIVRKKSISRKFKDLIVAADFRTVGRYVILEVLIPAARNMVVDASTKGIERIMYGDRAIRGRNYGPGPRITYNSPVNRGYGHPALFSSRVAPPVERTPRYNPRGDFILSSREEAETVLERMNDIIDQYEVVSIADFNELVGFPSSHVDNKWGWIYLVDVPIRQVREGYLIDFPPAEPIKAY